MFIFIFLAALCDVWHLSSLTRELGPTPPALEALSVNHWTTREVPISEFLKGVLILLKCLN